MTPQHTKDGTMGHTETERILRERGIRLELDEAKTGLKAGPPEKLTDEIRAAIRANSDELMRPKLLKEAISFVHHNLVRREDSTDTPAAHAAHDAFSNAIEAVQDAWDTTTLEQFKEKLREAMDSAQEAYKKAKREARQTDGEAERTADGEPQGGEVRL